MRIAVDTNVIVRLFVDDDQPQTDRAAAAVDGRDLVSVSTVALSEAVWVWRSVYRFRRGAVRAAVVSLLDLPRIAIDRAAVASGLAFLDAGADFADGVIAAEGRALGGEVFVSFDVRAVTAATRNGLAARTP